MLPKRGDPSFASLPQPSIPTDDRKPRNSARLFDPDQRRIPPAGLSEFRKKGSTALTQSFDRSDESLLGNLFNSIKCAISRWQEVRRLDPREIETVARELNLSPAELVSLMFTSSESLEQLNKRLAYEGLPLELLAVSHPAELRDMRRICSQCSSKTRCARDLRHKRMATPSKYCPNEPTLRAVALEALRARSTQVPGLPSKSA